MGRLSKLFVQFVALFGLFACDGSGLDEPPPSGEAFCYIGTVTGNDNAAAPLSPEQCHFVATLNPKTGPLGAVGLPLENAAILAVKDLNEAGLIAGKPVCLVSGDTRTDSDFAAQLIENILSEYPIRAVNGAAASSATEKVASFLTATNASKGPSARVAQVSCCSTSPVFSTNQQVQRTVPSDALQGVVLAKLAREQVSPPAEKVSVIYIDDIYGQSLADVFRANFEALGGKILASTPFTPGNADYFDVLEAAFSGDPDSIVLVAFPGDGAQILRNWRSSGLGKSVRWLATDGLREDRFLQGAGEGVITSLIGTAPVLKGENFADFDTRYRAFWNNEAPGIFTSNQYDAMLLIGLGLARLGNSTNEELSVAIQEVSSSTTGASIVTLKSINDGLVKASSRQRINYEGASGAVDITPTGDVLSNYRVWTVGTRGRIIETECNWSCSRSGEDDCQMIEPASCQGL
ncbi:MAG: ABC transporter substrate-binding protein [Myxococcota bacterium]|nr:ABC transporter substrate-binding protein [Myxococcota bacterium]